MNDDLTTALFEYVQERDRAEVALGDTLDVKTGLVLAGLTFLAIQNGDFIRPHLPFWQMVAQVMSVLAMVCGGVLAVCELWPRDYEREATPEKYEAWFAESEQFKVAHPEAASIAADGFMSARLKLAKERVKTNLAINKQKSRLMYASFFCLVISFGANIATLIFRLF